MSKAVALLGSMCTGHDGFPPRQNDEACKTVFINKKPVHLKGMHWTVHCKTVTEYRDEQRTDANGNTYIEQVPYEVEVCHDGHLQSGAPNVKIENLEVGRVGDPIYDECNPGECKVATGSKNVFIGG